MRNSKNYIRAIAFLAVVVILNALMDYVMLHPYYTQNLERDLKKQGDIDILFLGDSLTASLYNSDMIGKELGLTAFAMGFASANLETCSIALEDAMRTRKIGTVVLGWDLRDSGRELPSEQKSYYAEIFANTSLSRAKARIIPHLMNLRYTDVLQIWSGYFDPRDIIEVVKVKNTPEYKRGDVVIWHPDRQPRKYLGQGCYAYLMTEDRADGAKLEMSPFNSDCSDIPEKNVELLKEMKEMCDRRGTRLMAIASPQPQSVLENWGNYDDALERTRRVLDKLGIGFIDTNRLDEFKELQKDEYFRDIWGHMFYPQIDDYSKKICGILKEGGYLDSKKADEKNEKEKER